MSHAPLTNVTPTAVRLAAILDRPTSAGFAALAAVLGVSTRTVARALDDLERAGTIRRQRRHDRSGHRLPDRISPTGQDASFGLRPRNKVSEWTPEVAELRDAMNAAGVLCGWSNLRADVVADITRWVRSIGVRWLVAEAKARLWSPFVRHVAAFLRWWKLLRPERRPTCPFHPAESIDRGRRCPACAAERARSVPMPRSVHDAFRRRREIQSDPIRLSHPEEAR